MKSTFAPGTVIFCFHERTSDFVYMDMIMDDKTAVDLIHQKLVDYSRYSYVGNLAGCNTYIHSFEDAVSRCEDDLRESFRVRTDETPSRASDASVGLRKS